MVVTPRASIVSRDRTPEAIYPDEVLDLVTKEEEDDSSSNGE